MNDGKKQGLGIWRKLGVATVLCAIGLAIIVSLELSELRPAVDRVIPPTCYNNLKQIGLAFRMWSDGHGNYPFNVSTNAGGTMEWCAVSKNGFDGNAVFHFQVISNELNLPRLLVCPRDTTRSAAVDFTSFSPTNITYQMRTGTNVSVTNPQAVLLVCPIDGNTLYCDGSVTGR